MRLLATLFANGHAARVHCCELYFAFVNSIQLNHTHLQAAIVDLDGTMVDTLGDFMVALTRMLDDLGLPHAERAFVERTIGKGSEHLLRSTLQHAAGEPPTQAMFEHAWQRYQQHYLAINGQHADVFPGVAEGLQRLAAAAGW